MTLTMGIYENSLWYNYYRLKNKGEYENIIDEGERLDL